MRKLFFSVLASLTFVSGLLSQPEQFNFNVGNCNYLGNVKSASIYEYEQLFSETSSKLTLSTIEAPSIYFEYNINGKMITHVINSSKDMIAIKKIYSSNGNIKYEIKSKFPPISNKQDFIERLTLWNENLESKLDSTSEFAWKNDNNLEVVVYHYDYANFLVIRMPYQFAPPSHFKVNNKGDIINERRYSYQYGVLKTTEIAREYLDDKILLERITKDNKQIFKRYLYDSSTDNISNLIIDTGDGLLMRHEIYVYNDDVDSVMIYNSNNTLTREIFKKKEIDSLITTHVKIDSIGNRDKSSEIIEYKDKFENITKRYHFNPSNRRVKISEFHYEYY